jgi:hypothetical protein
MAYPGIHYLRVGPPRRGATAPVSDMSGTVTTEQVSAVAGTTVVARHDRCLARHQTITDPGHAAAAAVPPGPPPHAGNFMTCER